MNIIIYGNGTSKNHGCEAIVRGTVSVLGENNYTIMSQNIEDDYLYHLNDIANVISAKTPIKRNISFLLAYIKMKLKKEYVYLDGLHYDSQIKSCKGKADIALSVGGDNYCYGGKYLEKLDKNIILNKAYHKQGIKTVLWGCSIEPDVVMQKNVSVDLSKYDYIVVRESITYEAVKKVNSNVSLFPDPAFFMSSVKPEIPQIFEENVVGINISPVIIDNEKNSGIVLKNYVKLIEHILNNTNYLVALIPHVILDSNNDNNAIKMIYNYFKDNCRVIVYPDMKATELKYVISKCRFFIGARTHSTIAAYSTCVPTVVVWYSVKAKGIAKDLFGTWENYVLPAQELYKEDALLNSFLWIEKNELVIKEKLKKKMVIYKQEKHKMKSVITELVG